MSWSKCQRRKLFLAVEFQIVDSETGESCPWQRRACQGRCVILETFSLWTERNRHVLEHWNKLCKCTVVQDQRDSKQSFIYLHIYFSSKVLVERLFQMNNTCNLSGTNLREINVCTCQLFLILAVI